MPTIRIELFEGRSAEQKAALAREVTDACVRVLGGSPGSVDILFFDIARGDWATGGVLWSQQPSAAPPAPKP
jgi:4-oxalocrotonate tautomerase